MDRDQKIELAKKKLGKFKKNRNKSITSLEPEKTKSQELLDKPNETNEEEFEVEKSGNFPTKILKSPELSHEIINGVEREEKKPLPKSHLTNFLSQEKIVPSSSPMKINSKNNVLSEANLDFDAEIEPSMPSIEQTSMSPTKTGLLDRLEYVERLNQHLTTENKSLLKSLNEAKELLKMNENEKKAQSRHFIAIEASLEALKKKLNHAEKQLEIERLDKENMSKQSNKEIEELKNRLKALENEKENQLGQKDDLEKYEIQQKEMELKIINLEKEKEQLMKQIQSLVDAQKGQENIVNQLQNSEFEKEALKKQLNSLNLVQQENIQLQNQLKDFDKLKEDLIKQTKNLAQSEEQITSNQTRIKELENENDYFKTKNKEYENYLFESENLKKRVENLEKEKDTLLNQLKTSQNNSDLELERLKKWIEDLQQEKQALISKLKQSDQFVLDNERLQNKFNQMEQLIKEKDSQTEQLDSDKLNLLQKIKELEHSVSDQTKILEKTKQENLTLQNELEHLMQSYKGSELEKESILSQLKEREELEIKLNELLKENEEFKMKISNLTKDTENLTEKLQQNNDMKQKLKQMEMEIENLTKLLETTQKEKRNLEVLSDELKKEKEDLVSKALNLESTSKNQYENLRNQLLKETKEKEALLKQTQDAVKFEHEAMKLKTMINDAQITIDSFKTQMKQLSQENEKLVNQLKENDSLKQNLEELEFRADQLVKEKEFLHIQLQNTLIYKTQFEKIEIKLKQSEQDKELMTKQLEAMDKAAKEENEKLKSFYVQQLDTLEKKVKEKQILIEKMTNDFKEEKNQSEKLQKEIESINLKNQKLLVEIQGEKQKIKSLEKQVEKLSNQHLQSKESTAREFKTQKSSIQMLQNLLQDEQESVQKIKSEKEKLEILLIEKEKQIIQLQSNSVKEETGGEEVEELKRLLTHATDHLEESFEKFTELKQEHQKLKKLLDDLILQLADKMSKYLKAITQAEVELYQPRSNTEENVFDLLVWVDSILIELSQLQLNSPSPLQIKQNELEEKYVEMLNEQKIVHEKLQITMEEQRLHYENQISMLQQKVDSIEKEKANQEESDKGKDLKEKELLLLKEQLKEFETSLIHAEKTIKILNEEIERRQEEIEQYKKSHESIDRPESPINQNSELSIKDDQIVDIVQKTDKTVQVIDELIRLHSNQPKAASIGSSNTKWKESFIIELQNILTNEQVTMIDTILEKYISTIEEGMLNILLIENEKEIETLRQSIQGLTQTSQFEQNDNQVLYLRKIWMHEIQANQTLRSLITELRHRLAVTKQELSQHIQPVKNHLEEELMLAKKEKEVLIENLNVIKREKDYLSKQQITSKKEIESIFGQMQNLKKENESLELKVSQANAMAKEENEKILNEKFKKEFQQLISIVKSEHLSQLEAKEKDFQKLLEEKLELKLKEIQTVKDELNLKNDQIQMLKDQLSLEKERFEKEKQELQNLNEQGKRILLEKFQTKLDSELGNFQKLVQEKLELEQKYELVIKEKKVIEQKTEKTLKDYLELEEKTKQLLKERNQYEEKMKNLLNERDDYQRQIEKHQLEKLDYKKQFELDIQQDWKKSLIDQKHKEHCRILIHELLMMKFRLGREMGFRADLVYQKKYLLMLLIKKRGYSLFEIQRHGPRPFQRWKFALKVVMAACRIKNLVKISQEKKRKLIEPAQSFSQSVYHHENDENIAPKGFYFSQSVQAGYDSNGMKENNWQMGRSFYPERDQQMKILQEQFQRLKFENDKLWRKLDAVYEREIGNPHILGNLK